MRWQGPIAQDAKVAMVHFQAEASLQEQRPFEAGWRRAEQDCWPESWLMPCQEAAFRLFRGLGSGAPLRRQPGCGSRLPQEARYVEPQDADRRRVAP